MAKIHPNSLIDVSKTFPLIKECKAIFKGVYLGDIRSATENAGLLSIGAISTGGVSKTASYALRRNQLLLLSTISASS